MFENWHWVYLWGIACFLNYMFWIVKSLFDGGVFGFDRAKSRKLENRHDKA